jgi:hypothetical protein
MSDTPQYDSVNNWAEAKDLCRKLEQENTLLKEQLEATKQLCLKFYKALEENGFELVIE